METETLNVVLYPTLSVREYAILLSREFEDRGEFVLDDIAFYPHITLYMAEYPDGVREAIVQKLTEINRVFTNVCLEASGYSVEQKYVAISYLKTKGILEIQQNVIEACNGFRGGLLRTRDRDKIANYSETQINNLKTNGFRNVGDDFHPHLTLTKFKDEVDSTSLPSLNLKNCTVTTPVLALMRVGDFGTAREMIYIGK